MKPSGLAGDALLHLVIGDDGAIGSALADLLRQAGRPLLATSRRGAPGTAFLDLTDPRLDWLPDGPLGPAYLCAALTGHAACNAEPDRAEQVNARAPLVLADAIAARGGFPVLLGTDAADGPTASAYTRTKRGAEKTLLARPYASAVVTLPKVIGGDMGLVQSWVETLRRRRPIAPFSDVSIAPLSASFVAGCLDRVGSGRWAGRIALAASAPVSYATIAHHIADRLGLPADLIHPGRAPAGMAGGPTAESVRAIAAVMAERLGMEAPDPLEAFEPVLETLAS
jgi:dTDP-4-dehydrorhamnose reductase